MFRVWTSASTPRVDEDYRRFTRIALPRSQWNLFQRRHDRGLPVVTTWIGVLRISVARTNETRVHVFQLIRFPADVDDVVDGDVSTLQQADRLLVRRFAVRVGALGLRMPLVFLEHVAVGFDARDAWSAVVALRRNPIRRAGELIDPLDLRPAFWV